MKPHQHTIQNRKHLNNIVYFSVYWRCTYYVIYNPYAHKLYVDGTETPINLYFG